MADSNSKKPMALLLLVVVAVLVVIMVSGGDAEFAGHDKLTTKKDCEGAKGTWAKVMEPVEAADEAACTEAKGTWGGGKDAVGTEGEEGYVAAVADSCSKEAEAETCAAPDYAALTTEADCKAAHGTFTAAVVDDAETKDVDETAAAKCDAWKADATK